MKNAKILPLAAILLATAVHGPALAQSSQVISLGLRVAPIILRAGKNYNGRVPDFVIRKTKEMIYRPLVRCYGTSGTAGSTPQFCN